MCFPDINILCLCVKALPIIRQREQRTAILLLLFALSLPSERWVTPRRVSRGAEAMVEELCSKRWGDGSGERGPRGGLFARHPYAKSRDRAEGKTSLSRGFVLGDFYF